MKRSTSRRSLTAIMMMLIAILVLAIAGLGLPSASAAPANQGSYWQLIWSDEFDGTSIDTNKWQVSNFLSPRNNEDNYYLPANAYLQNGYLVLEQKLQSYHGAPYTSGQVISKNYVLDGTSPMRVEIRVKPPTGKGLHSAYWAFHDCPVVAPRCTGSQWPPEIDFLEVIGSQPTDAFLNWHYGADWSTHAGHGGMATGTNWTADFHTITVDYGTYEARWSIDGVEQFYNAADMAQANVPMKILLDTSIGGDWPGDPDATTVFPAYNYIDYVRVYRYVGPTPTATLQPTPISGSFRVEAGSTSSFVDTLGNTWMADLGYLDGGTVDRGAIAIANTTDDRIYQTERWGINGYKFSVAAGSYTVKLHFAETSPGITAAGQRVFSVSAEGVSTGNIDPFAQAGGANIAMIKTLNNVNVTDGELNIVFTHVSGEANMINGIEIIPAGLLPTNTPTNTPLPGQTFTPLPTATNTPPAGPVKVSLRVLETGMYVCADRAISNKTYPLDANRTTVGPWESFDKIVNADGTVSFKSYISLKYVTVDTAQTDAPLFANKTTIGTNEKFTEVANGDGTFSYRALANNKFVVADLGKSAEARLYASRTSQGQWTNFQVNIIP